MSETQGQLEAQLEVDGGITLSRRALWQSAGIAALAVATGGVDLPANAQVADDPVSTHPGFDPEFPPPGRQTAADFPVSSSTQRLSSYISQASARSIPPEVAEKTKWHILDTFAAIVAGSQLPGGKAGRAYVELVAGRPSSIVVGSSQRTDAVTAAMINGTMGHCHEVDDTGGSSGPWHPGINVVPAALALGELLGSNGTRFLRAVTLGYDIGGRVGSAAGLLRNFRTPTVSVCGIFGAAASAACMADLNEEQTRFALSYAAQQSSGIDSFRRDPDHIEKGFLNGGLGARGGVASALLVRSGFTGVHDIFTGPANFFALFRAAGQTVRPELLTAGLGERYDVLDAGFKRRPVAGAISAVLDSLETLLARQPLDPNTIDRIVIRYEPYSVTDNGGPIDANMQHAVALTLVDRRLTFRSVHDRQRFNDPLLTRLRSIIKISPVILYVQTGKYIDPSTSGIAATRGSKAPVVEITMADGTRFSQGDVPARGESNNPYTRDWVVTKATDLMAPILGARTVQALIERVLELESLNDIRELAKLLRIRNGGKARELPDWPSNAAV